MTSNWRIYCEACGKPQHGTLPCHEVTATRTVLSLPCGCIVTVWPCGHGDSPSMEAAITKNCQRHSADVAAKVREWLEYHEQQRAHSIKLAKNIYATAADFAQHTRQQAQVEMLRNVLRLLEAGPEGGP